MNYPNDNTEKHKNKHLNFEERITILLHLKDEFTPYMIVKELHRPINTILNKINRGTATQLKQRKMLLLTAQSGCW